MQWMYKIYEDFLRSCDKILQVELLGQEVFDQNLTYTINLTSKKLYTQ